MKPTLIINGDYQSILDVMKAEYKFDHKLGLINTHDQFSGSNPFLMDKIKSCTAHLLLFKC